MLKGGHLISLPREVMEGYLEEVIVAILDKEYQWFPLLRLGQLGRGFSGWLSGKESTCNAGETGDVGSIPESGRSLEEGMATHSSILAWRISWIEEPGGLQSMGSQGVGHY